MKKHKFYVNKDSNLPSKIFLQLKLLGKVHLGKLDFASGQRMVNLLQLKN